MDLMAIEYGVRQLHTRNVDATWRKDADEFAGCFTEDAEWRIGGAVLQGRDKIAETFALLFGRVDGAFPGVPAVDLPPQPPARKVFG